MKFHVRARADGSIGIPCAYRHRLGIQPGATILIQTDRQGRIWMKPQPAICSCCGMEQAAVSVVDGLCKPCETLVEMYVRDGMSIIDAIKKARKTGRDQEH